MNDINLTPFYVTELNVETPMTIIGDEMRNVANEILNFMEISSMPIDLVGPPGSGKSHIGAYVATEWARTHGVPAYTTLHDTDTTKSSSIAGFRMYQGNSVMVAGTVATAMQRGGSCFVDEFTHAKEGIQGGYNTITDRQHRTTAGNVTYTAQDTFRLILAHNTAQYAGNQQLMPSFASRLAVWRFEYPSIKTEAQIAREIVLSELTKHRPQQAVTSVPNVIICYLTSLMRIFRDEMPTLGLSARNVAIAVMLLEIASRREGVTNDQIDPHFGGGSDAIKRMVAERVLFKDTTAVSALDLKSESVMLAMRYITSIGVERFRSKILQAFEYHLDVKGSTVSANRALREKLQKSAV